MRENLIAEKIKKKQSGCKGTNILVDHNSEQGSKKTNIMYSVLFANMSGPLLK